MSVQEFAEECLAPLLVAWQVDENSTRLFTPLALNNSAQGNTLGKDAAMIPHPESGKINEPVGEILFNPFRVRKESFLFPQGVTLG